MCKSIRITKKPIVTLALLNSYPCFRVGRFRGGYEVLEEGGAACCSRSRNSLVGV